MKTIATCKLLKKHILFKEMTGSSINLKSYMMLTSCLASALPKPKRSNRSSGLIRNSYLLNKQMIIDNSCLGLANTQDERFTPFLVIKIKGKDC
jgi:hypothetical protein